MTSKRLLEAWTAVRMKWSLTGAYDSEVRHAMRDAIDKVKMGDPIPNFTANYWDLYDDHKDREEAAAELATVATAICKQIIKARELEYGI